MKNNPSEPAKGRRSTSAGVISLLELYTIAEAKSRLGWSDSAFRAAKRRRVSRLLASGKRRYVTGREIGALSPDRSRLIGARRRAVDRRRPGSASACLLCSTKAE